MRLIVKERCQTSSAGDYVVHFELEVDLEIGGIPEDGGEVRLGLDADALDPSDARWADLAERAVDEIRAGITDVCRERRFGARGRVTSIRIHPIDFRPAKFRSLAASRFRAMLDDQLS